MRSATPESAGPNLLHDTVVRSYYFLFYAILGSFMPFVSLFFERTLHFSGTEIGSISSVRQLLAVLAPPLWGILSDRLRMPRLLIAVGLAGSGGALLLFNEVRLFWPMMLLMTFFSFFHSPMAPLIDSITLGYSARTKARFGRVRAWGSLGFVFVGVCLWMVVRGDAGLGLGFWSAAVCAFLALTLVPLLPAVEAPSRGHVSRRAFAVFRQRDVFVLAFCALMGSFAMTSYYAFFSNYLHHVGLDAKWMAPIWALGPVSEMPFVFYADDIVRRVGIRRVFAMGLAAIAVRLFVLSLQPPTAIIVLSQCLHAFTFGAVTVGGLIYINSRAPADLRASAQSIYGADLGLGGVAGCVAAGWLVDGLDLWRMMAVNAGIAAAGLVVFLVFFRAHVEEGAERRA